ncbi:MAG TPA: hypothetical protein VGF94_23230 [Kofleriaceae bacterium]|jgi:tetratricopeptide (TPR) repeat protein
MRHIVFIALALAIYSPTRALADEPPPTAEQLDAAKKAFADGKALHDAGNLLDAVEKFKESYRLSKNPVLLYNIGLTFEEAGTKDLALMYFHKFLTDAPADAAERPTVLEHVKALEKEFGPNGEAATKPADNKPKEIVIKPVGTYSASDVQHQALESAPPGQPLDVTAFVPEDSGFKVTLYYRSPGEAEFTAKPMKWRYKELVARIPAGKVNGASVQYYIEVRDHDGNLVTRIGKSTVPNLVMIDATAKPRFYPDMTDDGPSTTEGDDTKPPPPPTAHVDDNPFQIGKEPPKPVAAVVATPTLEQHGDGWLDLGSTKFRAVKWSASAGAVALAGVSLLFYEKARSASQSLEEDSKRCGSPPCQSYDKNYDEDLYSQGHRDDTIYRVTLGVGVAAAAVAGYYWYRELFHHASSGDTTALHVTPAVDDHSVGAAAMVRF